MNAILNAWAFISAALGPLAPLIVIGMLGVYIILLTLPLLFNNDNDPFSRLHDTEAAQLSRAGKNMGGTTGEAMKLNYSSNSNKTLAKFAKHLEPQNDDEMSTARLQLVRAGYRSKSAVQTMNFAKMIMGVGFMIVGILYLFLQPGEMKLSTTLLVAVVPGAIGYYLPMYWVTRRIQQRQEDIINGFPDALDLMLICVEAGQSLDQAILRVSGEIKKANPTLAEEYEIVANEMRAGKDRVDVLRDMAERCDVNDVGSFVTVLVQSAKFGTAIADALRVYASEMRDKRVMRAEEKANVLPTKLTIGTMMFTVPPLMIIMVGPSVYGIYINFL